MAKREEDRRADHEPPGAPRLEGREEHEARERQAVGARVVHTAIRREGEEELRRTSAALAWSGLAAGLSMGLSLAAAGLLHAHLPAAPWRPLVTHLGYTVGFLVVILARQQLFTENTLTPIIPLLTKRDRATLVQVARLWTVVLVANLAGALLFAAVAARTGAFDAGAREGFHELSWQAVEGSFGGLVFRGLFAGWLVALLVWMLARSKEPSPVVIVVMTYLIPLAGFPHVIAGAVDAFFLAASGAWSWTGALGGYVLPTLSGNVLGGVSLVAVLNHAQVVATGGRR
jgi:formate-nitrite transporter family protein